MNPAPRRRANEQGSAVVGALGLIFGVLSTIALMIQGGKLGWTVGQKIALRDAAPQICEGVKESYRAQFDQGRITWAQYQSIARKIDDTAHLWRRVAERMEERQDTITKRTATGTGMYFAVYAAANPAMVKNVIAKIAIGAGGIGGKGFATAAGLGQPLSVDVSDLEDVLAPIRERWARNDDAFQQAVAAAKVRVFLDQMNELQLSREQKQQAVRDFVARLEKDGWRTPGFAGRGDLVRFVKDEARKYRGETAGAPRLIVHSVAATPGEAGPLEVVELEAQMSAPGLAKGDLRAWFVVDGKTIPARVAVQARLDTLAAAHAAYEIPASPRVGRYPVILRAELYAPEIKGKTGQDRLEARGETAFSVRAAGEAHKAMARWFNETEANFNSEAQLLCCSGQKCDHEACERQVDVPCNKPEEVMCCRIETVAATTPGDSPSKVCGSCDCELKPMGGIPMFPLVFDTPYWFELDAGFLTCFRSRLKRHLKDYRTFLGVWARAPKRGGGSADGALYDSVKLLYDETDAALLTCQTEACKNKCALAGMHGEISGMLTQECQCVK
jgi:hypothetical protein